jgi:UDP:flavonoid glycosyltransferase YjiC (YdhE family)
MRVLIVAVGSRGDVAPCTGLGAALRAAGHDVTIAAYPMFDGMVRDSGLEFRALPAAPRLLEAAGWERASTGPLGAVRLLRLTRDHMRDLHAAMLTVARQGADVLLLQGISAVGGYHIGVGLNLPTMGLGMTPVYPTREFPPALMTARSLGRLGNRVAGAALVRLGSPVLAGPVQELRAELGLPAVRAHQAVFGLQDAARWPAFCGVSPAVLPRPADWRDGLEVSGYWWPACPPDWQPPAELADFLAAGPPPVFAGFGSMVAADADRLGELVTTAGRRAGVRMIIQGSLARTAPPSGDSIAIGDVPHEWLFPRLAAVIHHAGAGTTAAGLRAGIPAVTVPKLGDQPFWAARLAALGAGPGPIRHARLSAAGLTAAITDAITNPSYRVRALELASRIGREDGAAPVLRAVARL